MNKLCALLALLITTVGYAGDDLSVPPPVKASRISIWSGPAPIDDHAAEAVDVWVTVHQPTNPNGTAIVICPGGGYGGLVVGGEGHGIAKWLNQHGITGAVLEYRLPKGRHQVPLRDAQRAIRFLRSGAERWKLNPSRIGIMGFSAGGHLASTAATHFDQGNSSAKDEVQRMSCRPDFAILVYPVVTLGPKGHAGTRTNLLGKDPSPEQVKHYSNERHVTADTPPVFLTHALDDKVVSSENSRQLFDALQEKGVRSQYLELPSGGHGLNGYKGPMWDAWQTQSIEWLDDLWKAK